MMAANTFTVRIHLNPPKSLKPPVEFMIGNGDDKIAEGMAGDVAEFQLEPGYYELLVLARGRGIESLTGTTGVLVESDLDLKLKYGLFNKKITLVTN